MTRRARGNCPACGARVSVTPLGRIWAHKVFAVNKLGEFVDVPCKGNGMPAPVKQP